MPFRGIVTFAVGHLALGYLTGKATSKLLHVSLNIPLLFVASVIADIDFLVPGLGHRGPAHSLIVIFLLFLPIFVVYRKKASPYFIAMIQHSILGDYLVGGGVQLLWPATTFKYGEWIKITSLANILIEWVLFVTSFMALFKTRDLWRLLQHHASNLLLSIPVFTVLFPPLLSFPMSAPIELIIPNSTYITVFVFSILIDFRYVLKRFPPSRPRSAPTFFG